MSPDVWLMAGFFLFMLAAVSAAGYVFILRPAQSNPRPVEIPTALTLPDPDEGSPRGLMIQAFRLLGEAIPGAQSDSNPLRKRLAAAGYRRPTAVSIFYGIKCVLGVLLGVTAGWLAVLYDGNILDSVIPFVCAFGFGYLIPDRVLGRKVLARKTRLRRALPAAMDLLILAIEAGQALDQAVHDASRGLRATFPDLAAELMLMHLELRASKSRSEAIRNFSDRVNDLEVRKFASLLLDTDRFGASLGPALRTHAKYLRIRFRQLAQERARK
ncbi:MAG: type II secretion system F family protein, partial [Bryobacteraceae bacterium]